LQDCRRNWIQYESDWGFLTEAKSCIGLTQAIVTKKSFSWKRMVLAEQRCVWSRQLPDGFYDREERAFQTEDEAVTAAELFRQNVAVDLRKRRRVRALAERHGFETKPVAMKNTITPRWTNF